MKKTVLFTSLMIASISASAATLQGTSSGVFQNVQKQSSSALVSGENTNSLSWGAPSRSHKQSNLKYTGGKFTGEAEQNITIGKFDYHNGTQLAGTGAQATDFVLSLDFTSPFSELFNFDYSFSLENTTNPAGDMIKLVTGAPLKFFTHEGKNYFFTLLGFSEITTSYGYGYGKKKTSYGALQDFIFAEEGKNKSFNLVGQFTVSEVPLPAAIWFFGPGLLGFMAMRRRAKAQQTT